jgi:carbon monoxide dehydrogenase subunit G
MKINGSYTINAPQETVWTMLLDPVVLASIMPGCEQLNKTDEDQYEGVLMIKVGPVQGKFNGKVHLSNIQEPHSYNIMVDGKGAPGFVKGTGSLQLENSGESTILHYEGDAQVGGRLASVGQRLLDTSAKAIIRQSLEGLENQIAQQQATATSDTAVPEAIAPPTPPSQTQFALGVAQNMWEEFLAEQDQTDLLRKALILLGGVLALYVFLEWYTSRIAAKVSRQLR